MTNQLKGARITEGKIDNPIIELTREEILAELAKPIMDYMKNHGMTSSEHAVVITANGFELREPREEINPPPRAVK